MAHAQIDPELQAAILAQDQPQLEALLRVSVTCCVMVASDGQDQDDQSVLEQCA